MIASPSYAFAADADLPPLDDITELEPLPPSRTEQDSSTNHAASTQASLTSSPMSLQPLDLEDGPSAAIREAQSTPSAHHLKNHTRDRSTTSRHPAQLEGSFAPYVTVSAILSRSGALLPSSARDQALLADLGRQHSLSGRDTDAATMKELPRRRPSTALSSGNALEALGALLLHSDSKGRATSLSSQKWRSESREPSAASQQRRSRGSSTPYAAFMRGLRDMGAATLGLRMPEADTGTSAGDGSIGQQGDTIAERRARRRIEQVDDLGSNPDFIRVRSRRSHPTFEVSRPPSPRNGWPHSVAKPLSPQADPRAAFRRTHSSAVYGIGSSFGLDDPPEAPPTPLGIPGDWLGGGNASWRFGGGVPGGDEDMALLLPPPLLDDTGSDPASFEGLLGIRRAREEQEAKRRLQRLAARNRPAHKVGLMTALSNFVKAAHAADLATQAIATANKSRRRDTRPSMLPRRFTEPSKSRKAAPSAKTSLLKETFGSADVTEADLYANRSESRDLLDGESEAVHRSRSGRASLDNVSTSSQTLETVPEDLDSSHYTDVINAHGGPPSVSITRRSSLALANAKDRPPGAPRLLPIQMSPSMSPFTPLARSDSLKSTPSDYMSARQLPNIHSSSGPPSAPRLGPTMLSLPPSPWTLHTGRSRSSSLQHQAFALALSAGDSTVPGTPRLAPTHLSVLPSPYPGLSESPATSLSSMSGKPSKVASGGHADAVSVTPDWDLSSKSNVPDSAITGAAGALRRRATVKVAQTGNEQNDSGDAATTAGGDVSPPPFRKGSGSLERAQAHGEQRSFLLWWLLGDIGLGFQRRLRLPAGPHEHNAAVAIAAVAGGFFVFCMSHLIEVLYEVAEVLSLVFWFTRWVVLNLTGQTILSRCVMEAYALIQAEWTLVAQEDHEDKQHAQPQTASARPPRKGLSRLQVIRGFIEVVCLHSVTRERWLREGAGLSALEGWEKSVKDRAAEAANAAHSDDESSSDEDGSDDDLVVTKREDDLLEFTRTPRLRPRWSSAAGANGTDTQDSYFSTEDGRAYDGQHPRRQSSGAISVRRQDRKVPRERSLIRTLKWASRLAVGAYGLHVHIVDLPPTFTPSGERFSRQTFAHLSRLSNPDDVLHADIQQITSSRGEDGESDEVLTEVAYQPTFYVARDHVRKTIVVAIRGTQSFSDIIADLDMRTEQFPLPSSEADIRGVDDILEGLEGEELTCHAGVLRAAQGLLKSGSTLLDTVARALEDNEDFGLAFVGHSLGAAIASAVVMLLGQYSTTSQDDQEVQQAHLRRSKGPPIDGGRWVIGAKSSYGLPSGRPLQAISFAPPATFSAALCRRAALGTPPLVTSVVLGADIIPRAGHGQARELRRVLGALARVRKRHEGKSKGDEVEGAEEDARVHIFRSWWKWKGLAAKAARARDRRQREAGPYANPQVFKSRPQEAGLTRAEQVLKRRIESQLWKLRCDVENDLYSTIKARAAAADEAMASHATVGAGDDVEVDSDADEEAEAMARLDVQSTAQKSPSPAPRRRPIPPSPWIGPHSAAPLHQLAERRQALDAATLKSEAQLGGVLIPAGRVLYIVDEGGDNEDAVVDGEQRAATSGRGPERRARHRIYSVDSPLSFFSLPEFTTSMFASHLPSSYEAVIEDL